MLNFEDDVSFDKVLAIHCVYGSLKISEKILQRKVVFQFNQQESHFSISDKMKMEDKANLPRVRIAVLGHVNVGKSGKLLTRLNGLYRFQIFHEKKKTKSDFKEIFSLFAELRSPISFLRKLTIKSTRKKPPFNLCPC